MPRLLLFAAALILLFLFASVFPVPALSSMQQAVVVADLAAEKDEKGPGSWGARVKTSERHD